MIQIVNLNKSFGEMHVLKNINLTIYDGDIYGLIGRSGAGKSTLLRCINGLETYDSGSITIDGYEIREHSARELRKFRMNIGMIFQNFSLMERKTVYENIALPMECWGYRKDTIEQRVKELLTLVDIESKIYDKPRVLSGGQKQRVAIARALALNPKILLCDEATSALDPKTTKSILSLLRRINEIMGITIVLVTHQMAVVRQICQKVSIMEEGEISASGEVSSLFMHQSQAFRNFLGEEYDDILPSDGNNIKIFYENTDVGNRILSNMARNCDIEFSVSWAKVERYRDDVLGSIIINVADKDMNKVTNYLTSMGVAWEYAE